MGSPSPTRRAGREQISECTHREKPRPVPSGPGSAMQQRVKDAEGGSPGRLPLTLHSIKAADLAWFLVAQK